jgi:4-hydroxybenzoate polyprenyltransferase
VVGLMRACHPDACVAVTAVAVLLAVAVGRGAVGTVLVGAAVLAGQLCVGWTNDYLDANRDLTAGRSDKPVASGSVGRTTVGAATLVAGVACVPLSLAVGWLPGGLHLVAVAVALGYDFGLKATVASVVPYVVSFGLLPLFAVLGPAPHPPWWLPVAGALLGGGAHFANVLPDLTDDAAAGVLGLPHRIGPTGSRWAAVLLLLAASVVLVLGPTGHLPVRLALACAALVVLGAGLLAGRRPGSRAVFRAVLVVALLAVGQLVVAGASLAGH